MLKRKNKKGFTLAELLIVVAIIAVLVAIAVPLFVGALSDAEERVKDANIRAVRAAAVSEILLDEEHKGYAKTTGGSYYDSCWFATAHVDGDGTVTNLEIIETNNFMKYSTKVGAGGTGYCDKKDVDDEEQDYYTVIVKIFELKVEAGE